MTSRLPHIDASMINTIRPAVTAQVTSGSNSSSDVSYAVLLAADAAIVPAEDGRALTTAVMFVAIRSFAANKSLLFSAAAAEEDVNNDNDDDARWCCSSRFLT